MKLSTKQKKLKKKLEDETAFMLSFTFPCGRTGQDLKNENNEPCNTCKILLNCIDYYSSQPNQKGKILDFETWKYHDKRLSNRKLDKSKKRE
jgi:hypothetical protein